MSEQNKNISQIILAFCAVITLIVLLINQCGTKSTKFDSNKGVSNQITNSKLDEVELNVEPIELSKLIIGEWKATELSISKGFELDDFNDEKEFKEYKKILETKIEIGSAFRTELTFYKNGKFIRNTSREINTGKYTFDDDDKIILDFGNKIDKIKKINLTKTDLIFNSPLSNFSNKDVKMKMIFKRKT